MTGRILFALTALALACAGPAPSLEPAARADANPLLGRWHSDRALTLAELAEAPSVRAADRELFTRPTFFGELVLEIDETHITTILPYHRAADRYRILSRGPEWVAIESADAQGVVQTFRCQLREDQLLVPVPGYGFHEVFVRVTEPD